MNDSKNLTIAVLSITAVILLVGVILSANFGTNTAMAIGQSDRGGDYTVVTNQFTENKEMVCIIDAAAQRMNVYSWDITLRDMRLWDSIDLQKVFGATR